uniref:Nucleolar GTP-binding protein 2 n=1 Tax=Romanomermis culicivorax TaxID=13658 RepID=A0A915K5W3_ROMCU
MKAKGNITFLDRAKNSSAVGGHNRRDRATIKRLLIYKNFKPIRDKHGKIVKAAPFQERLASGTVARVEPNRKWFGNTRVIGQQALQNFQEHLGKVIRDPYQVVMRQTKLPITLLNENAKNSRVHLLDTETFETTFGPKSLRKKPKLQCEDLEPNLVTLQTLAKAAASESSTFTEKFIDNHLGSKGGSRNEFRDPLYDKGRSKRIWNELYKVLDSSDVVCQVVDARDPQGTRCLQVERFLRKEKPHKHLILILNKVDLVPTWITQKWIAVLSAEYPTVAFHASINNSFGKGALINLLRQFGKLHNDKQQISIGFIGYPNVGKSSIINTLRKKKVCNVAPLAGETKVWQYVTLMRKIFLIDCPGIVYPSGDCDTALILKGVVRVENVKDPENHISAVLDRVKREYIIKTYQILDWLDVEDFLTKLAQRCGRLLKGGEPDLSTTAKMILNDFQRGRLPYFVPPAGCLKEVTDQVVQEKWCENEKNLSGTKETGNDIEVRDNVEQDSFLQAEETKTRVQSKKIKVQKQDLLELVTSTEFDKEDNKSLVVKENSTFEEDPTKKESTHNSSHPEEKETMIEKDVEDDDQIDLESCSGLSQISGLSDLELNFSDRSDDDEKAINPRSKRTENKDNDPGKKRSRGRRGGEKNKKKQKTSNETVNVSSIAKGKSEGRPEKLWKLKKRKKPKHQI